MSWISEFRVAIAMVALAVSVPLLWAEEDARHRASLRKTRLQACIAHHELADCAMWRESAGPDETANVICQMRFDQRACQRFMEGR